MVRTVTPVTTLRPRRGALWIIDPADVAADLAHDLDNLTRRDTER